MPSASGSMRRETVAEVGVSKYRRLQSQGLLIAVLCDSGQASLSPRRVPALHLCTRKKPPRCRLSLLQGNECCANAVTQHPRAAAAAQLSIMIHRPCSTCSSGSSSSSSSNTGTARSQHPLRAFPCTLPTGCTCGRCPMDRNRIQWHVHPVQLRYRRFCLRPWRLLQRPAEPDDSAAAIVDDQAYHRPIREQPTLPSTRRLPDLRACRIDHCPLPVWPRGLLPD
jgi:hypothetical protein